MAKITPEVGDKVELDLTSVLIPRTLTTNTRMIGEIQNLGPDNTAVVLFKVKPYEIALRVPLSDFRWNFQDGGWYHVGAEASHIPPVDEPAARATGG